MALTRLHICQDIVKGAFQKLNFHLSKPKHVVGTLKDGLNEMVLLSTENK